MRRKRQSLNDTVRCIWSYLDLSNGKGLKTVANVRKLSITYVCLYVCMCIMCVCMYVCMYVCVYVCVCIMCVCMYVCMYVCVYVCRYVYVCFLYILLSMLHHPEVTLHTVMCLAIGTCLWVGDAGSACALGVGHCIPFTVFILRLVFLSTCSLHLHHYSLS